MAIKPSARMANSVWQRLATEYPEYPELYNLLALAAVTWPRYGLGVDSLSKMSDSELALLKMMLE